MDARTEQPHTAPDKAGAAGRGHYFIAAQPEVHGQQHKPRGGQRLVREGSHRQRREEHKHPRARHTAPQLGLLVVFHAAEPRNDGLRQPALQGVAEQPPPAEILEPRGQDAAQQLEEQRRQRQRVREQHAGAERVDRAIIRAEIRQVHRAAAEQLPAQVMLGGVGAGVVQNPIDACRVQHPHAVDGQKNQCPHQCAGQRPAVFFQCFHLTFSGQTSWTAWWTSSRPSSGQRRRGAAPSRWGRFPRRAGCAKAQCR